MWPCGFCLHRNGDLYATFGRYTDRLNPDCEPVGEYRLPMDLPYNSHAILDNGHLVTKASSDYENSPISVLDPESMQEVCPPTLSPEPSISRLSSVGNTV